MTERKTSVTLLTTNIQATFTTSSSSDFYYDRLLLLRKPSIYQTPQLQFRDVIVGLVTV